MGIQGLLNALKDITRPVHVREYQGLKAGVDASCWLHRAVYCCANELMEGEDTDKYVTYCLERIFMLQRYGVTPVVVFDGRPLPAKAHTHRLRKSVRDENRERAQKALRDGSKELAHQFFQKSVEITHDMAHKLLVELRARKIEAIVAPYEADAQLTYLSKHGLVDFVITEDSDIIPFGCKRCVFKMDKEGYAQEIQRKHLGANSEPSFLNWSDDMFVLMCTLAGCDYLPKIPQLGLKTAYRLVKKHRTQTKLVAALRDSKFTIPDDFDTIFDEARLTFKHQTVYDTQQQCLKPLNPLPGHLEGRDLNFLGPMLPNETAIAIANGAIHPFTLTAFVSRIDEPPKNEEIPAPLSQTQPIPAATFGEPCVAPTPAYACTTFKPQWLQATTEQYPANNNDNDNEQQLFGWDLAPAQVDNPVMVSRRYDAIDSELRSDLRLTRAVLPLAAAHFTSPIVSDKFETLQRRKRRLSDMSKQANSEIDDDAKTWADSCSSIPEELPLLTRDHIAADRCSNNDDEEQDQPQHAPQRLRSSYEVTYQQEEQEEKAAEFNDNVENNGVLLQDNCLVPSREAPYTSFAPAFSILRPRIDPVAYRAPTSQDPLRRGESYWDKVLGRGL